jgi:hypothetical protein
MNDQEQTKQNEPIEFGKSKTQEQINQIIGQLKKGKKLHDAFAYQFKNQYLIAGKLAKEWKQHFRIDLPPDMNPQICISVASELMKLYQEASFLKAEADARLSACKNASDDRYRVRFAELVAEYKAEGKKLPAKDTLVALAEHSISHLKNTVAHAEIELSFWKEILNNLSQARKLLENATINLSVDAKALQQERYLDRLNKERNL